MKRISRTQEILERLKAEGKVRNIEFTPEQMKEWFERCRKIKEESQRKQAQSWLAAKDVWLD